LNINNPNFNLIPKGISGIVTELSHLSGVALSHQRVGDALWLLANSYNAGILFGISIQDTGLKEINADDLLGLDYLDTIYIFFNQLTSVPSDLFKYTRKLKYFFTEENQMKKIKPRMFDSILEDEWN
jgi:hypothetical protein